jgi:hypothetical protein
MALRTIGLVVVGLLALSVAGCGSDEPAGAQPGDVPSCESGAPEVISFLQRTLDDIGDADVAELAAYEDRFNVGVDGLLQRAQEMHCTEEGFNNAVIALIADLEPNGPVGEALIDSVREVGLGSLDADRGGPLKLPGS